jgi:hypothetical protein
MAGQVPTGVLGKAPKVDQISTDQGVVILEIDGALACTAIEAVPRLINTHDKGLGVAFSEDPGALPNTTARIQYQRPLMSAPGAMGKLKRVQVVGLNRA